MARRVGYTGVGVDLRTGSPTPSQVRDTVRSVFADSRYRRAAEAVGRELRATDAPRAAADLLEDLIHRKRPQSGARREV
ncbi:hypothetical protein [Krasilnikovia sp. M28-CT-15]|uniref:hypothetical protein n=1 Tax=Krasilnikovia sp. M28-CT-15 TaxID=3373540 RepID=UPI00387751FD